MSVPYITGAKLELHDWWAKKARMIERRGIKVKSSFKLFFCKFWWNNNAKILLSLGNLSQNPSVYRGPGAGERAGGPPLDLISFWGRSTNSRGSAPMLWDQDSQRNWNYWCTNKPEVGTGKSIMVACQPPNRKSLLNVDKIGTKTWRLYWCVRVQAATYNPIDKLVVTEPYLALGCKWFSLTIPEIGIGVNLDEKVGPILSLIHSLSPPSFPPSLPWNGGPGGVTPDKFLVFAWLWVSFRAFWGRHRRAMVFG